MNKIRIFIWGCGQIYEEHKESINDEYIIGYIDTDISKQNKLYNNKQVISPEEILNHDNEYDYILIGTQKCETAIINQAIQLGINKERILPSNVYYSPIENLHNASYRNFFEDDNVKVIKNWHYTNGGKTTIFSIDNKLGEILNLLVIPCGCLGNNSVKREISILASGVELYHDEIEHLTNIEIPVNSEKMVLMLHVSGIQNCFLKASFKEGNISKAISKINNPETRRIFRAEVDYQLNMQYHERDYAVLEKFKDKSDYMILDIGANVGQSAMTFLSITKMDVISFEPHPNCNEALITTAEIFGKDRMSIINKGVGSCSGELIFYIPSFDTGVSQIASFSKEWVLEWIQRCVPDKVIEDRDIQQIRVPVTTVDDALKECKKAVFFVKIDAESFEYDVIKGMEEVIKKDAPLMLLELSSFDKQVEILEYVNRFHKYRIMYYDYEAEQFTKADLRGSINYFLVPEQGNVYEELKELL